MTQYLKSIGDIIRMRYLEKHLPQATGKMKCLDAGAGFGHYREMIERKGYQYYGVDIKVSDKFIKRADISLEIPFKDNFFGVVISIDVIEEIERDRDAIAEIYRVLKRGGELFLHTPNSEQTHILAYFPDNPNHVRKGYTEEELYKILSVFTKVDILPTFNILECIAWEIVNLKGTINFSRLLDFDIVKYENLGWLARCVK